jgi:methyl-accepting chemotaxis protein
MAENIPKMTYHRTFRRRKILIDKPLQLRYVMYSLLMLLAALLVASFSFYSGVRHAVTESFSEGKICENIAPAKTLRQPWLDTGENNKLLVVDRSVLLKTRQQELVADIFLKSAARLIPTFLALILLIAWLTVFLTHRIAGPMRRVCHELRMVNHGDLKIRIAIRPKDECGPLVQSINSVLTHFDLAVTFMKRVMRKNEGDPAKMIAELREKLDSFKTTGE